MQHGTCGSRSLANRMRRAIESASRRPVPISVAVLGAAVAAWSAFSLGGFAAGFEREGQAEAPASLRRLEVTVSCEGWSGDNVALGAFVSGFSADGAKIDEQVLFEEPGARAIDVPEGFYELSLQLPVIMVEDGSMRAAGDPVPVRFDESGSPARAAVAYRDVESAALSDQDLSEIAKSSFRDQSDAEKAFSRAMAKRDEGRG